MSVVYLSMGVMLICRELGHQVDRAGIVFLREIRVANVRQTIKMRGV